VDTNACNVGCGGVRFQVEDGEERVIAYCSKMLNKAERNFCVTRRELLAMMRAPEEFHKYVYGREFHLCMDHSALTRILSFKNVEGQSARWIQRLQEYNFNSEQRQGLKHSNANTLPRRPCQEECTHCHKVEEQADVEEVRAITNETAAGCDQAAMGTEQQNDPDLGPNLEEVELGLQSECKDVADRSLTYKSKEMQSKGIKGMIENEDDEGRRKRKGDVRVVI
jgi:hypothetical protein